MHPNPKAAEEDLIRRVLKFANLTLPNDQAAAVEVLKPVCASIALDSLANDQADLQQWLERITSRRIVQGKRRGKWKVASLEQMYSLAQKCVIESHFRLLKRTRFLGTRLGRKTRIAAPDTEAAYGFALALMLDRSTQWSRRLRRCQWRPCGKFFLTPPSRGGGSGQHMCSTEVSGNSAACGLRGEGVQR
jgi:hypothetical protein